MNTRYQIHNCEVDFTEQTLIRDGEVFNLQHKVMQVLKCLLDKQGELVTIDELMVQVWSDTVVSPNTLQRCIAQLRKAFGDTSQAQRVIKTYPRRGYALITEVVASNTAVPTAESTQPKVELHTAQKKPLAEKANRQSKHKSKAWLISILACTVMLVLVVIMIAHFHIKNSVDTPSRAHITSVMTASDAHTGKARYSSSGKHLVFQRYSDFCQSTLWVQDVTNKQETALTRLQKRISDVAWSPQDNGLLVAQSNPCIAPEHTQCWQLEKLTLDANMQLQHSQPIGSCEHKQITQVNWLDKQSALIIEAMENGRRQLTHIDLDSGQKQAMFTQGNVLSFTPIAQQQVAVLSHLGSARLALYRINADGEVLQRIELDYGTQLSVFNRSKLSYAAKKQQLLIESNGRLFEVLDSGELRKLFAVPNSLSDFDFALSNSVIAATRGVTKQDATLQDISGGAKQSLFPSKGVETYLRFAPGSDAIAFVSNRSAELQIWLSESANSQPRQLSQFSTDAHLNGLEWLASGDALVLVINDQLAKLSLSGELQLLALPMRVKYLHQALSDNQVLIEYQHDFQEVIAKVDLHTLQVTPIHFGLFNDVQLDTQNNLWFIDSEYRLNMLADNELEQPLSDVTINGLRAYKDGVAISSKQMALLYLSEKNMAPQKLGDMQQGTWLQDIKAEQLIWAYKQARNSDIVELQIQ